MQWWASRFDVTKTGWFDSRTFELWFCHIFLPHVDNIPGEKVVIADNLASHFTSTVESLCRENNIYFTTIPLNSTHLMQPLDVAFFKPLKSYWQSVLETWRKESRARGTIPKQHFPILLTKLYSKLHATGKDFSKSGFRKTVLYPFDPDQVLRVIPGGSSQRDAKNIGRNLDATIIDMLKEHG